jgi:hypothetical protein
MFVEELIVKSSIQVFMANPEHPKPEVFGSGCLVNYVDRLFFLSVFHVTNYDLSAYLETNLPANEIGPPIQPIGGLCSFDLFKVTKDMQAKDFEDLLQKPKETLDITFAEIKTPFTVKKITIFPAGVEMTVNGTQTIGRGIFITPPGYGMTSPTGQYLNWAGAFRFGMGKSPTLFMIFENSFQ